MKKHSIFYGLLIILFSCKWAEKKFNTVKHSSSLYAVDTLLYSMPTRIMFSDTQLDLGNIREGQEKEIVYRYKNIGDKPLVLFNVSPGCGCTIADYSQEPLGPGEGDSIMARFDSKGKEGSYIKNIRVNCNTEEKVYNLSFKVNVIKK